MRVTDSLEQDHRIIEIMLPAVQRLGQRAQFTWQEQAPAQQEAFDKDGAEMAVGFLRTFVDGYHHGPRLRRCFGVPHPRHATLSRRQ